MPKGTTSRSAEQIAEEIEGIGSLLSVESGYNTLRIAVSSLSADFNDAFAVADGRGRQSGFSILKRSNANVRVRSPPSESEKAQPHVVARNLLRSRNLRRSSLRAQSARSRGNCPANRARLDLIQTASGMLRLAKRSFRVLR